ncbi:protein ALP1-like [Nicotiana tabacum]|uniref:Nuclease HARBI1 n=2 Tax=Nicotiana TaxID=4085 RepID=A0A1S4DQE9_TOBAC|nr:PREDICTED: putative nuclease HARBI1 [Nicotiana sylvestris]XP_016515645.1 PREDICTED: putative nuclease HARBI1 [Nicotiana tabacum]
MEISSFPFPTQEDYPSNFFSFFQDFDFPATDNTTATAFASEPLPKKRKTDDFDFDSIVEEGSLKTVEDILSKFLGFDNEEEKINTQFDFSSHQPTQPLANQSVFEFSNQQKMESAKPLTGNNKRSRQNSAEFISTSEDSTGGDNSQPLQQRRLWVKDRSKAWWEQCNSPDFPEEEFKKAFRMSKGTFDMICDELESVVTKKDTMLRQAIPVRQRVAVCIWRLATGEPLREVSKRFGLGISTCHKLVLEVCTAIRSVLMPKFVQWPDENKMNQIKQEYQMFSGVPNVGGSIYTTHVPIIAPKESVAAYFNKRHTERNQKTSYSVTVQGVVDPKGIFTDVCIGWPGSMSDDKVLEKSALFQRANRGLLKDVWVVGNSGFPLMDWVLAPYTRQNLTWTQHAFNGKVGEIQRVAKEAFMRMKARWSCLQKRTEVKLQDLPVVLGACCVLHNICEMRGEELNPELRFDLFDDEMVPENIVRSMNAVQARDQIAHKLLHHNHAGTNFL